MALETKSITLPRILESDKMYDNEESTGFVAMKEIFKSRSETYEPIISHPISPQ